MDAERVSRLGGLVGIGIASQISSEIMQSKSSAHSFWLIIALSLAMLLIQTLTDQVMSFRESVRYTKTGRNFAGWLLTIGQTLSGIETIVWTLYGNGVGQWILRLYEDLFLVPTFLYFLPVWAFLFGFLSVNLSKQKNLAKEGEGAVSLIGTIKSLEDRLVTLEGTRQGAGTPSNNIKLSF